MRATPSLRRHSEEDDEEAGEEEEDDDEARLRPPEERFAADLRPLDFFADDFFAPLDFFADDLRAPPFDADLRPALRVPAARVAEAFFAEDLRAPPFVADLRPEAFFAPPFEADLRLEAFFAPPFLVARFAPPFALPRFDEPFDALFAAIRVLPDRVRCPRPPGGPAGAAPMERGAGPSRAATAASGAPSSEKTHA